MNPVYRRFAPVITASLISLALSLLQVLMGDAELRLFELLRAIAGVDDAYLMPVWSLNWYPTLLLLTLVAYLSVWIGLKFGGTRRLAAFLFLFCLAIAADCIACAQAHINAHPILTVLAIVAGLGCGVLLKADAGRTLAMEQQYRELQLLNLELQQSRIALVKADETERRLLAADLHDQVLNDMKQVGHKFDQFVRDNDPESASFIRTQLQQVVSEIADVMDNLCPATLQQSGIASAIKECLNKGAQRSGFETAFSQKPETEPVLSTLGPVQQQLVYRLVQESVTNICKHAQAKMVSATIDLQGTDLIFRINDDGKGLDQDNAVSTSRGLVYMRLRAALMGGKVKWMAGENGKGTCVEIAVPVHRAEPAAVRSG